MPAPEAHLLLEIPHGDGHSVRSTPFEVDNGPDGAFQIPTVAVPRLGNYCLRLTAPGFAIKDREIFLPLEPRGTIDLGNIILKPANLSVSGIVVDSSGNPVAGVEVVAAHSGRPLDDEPDTLEWQREDARAVTAADGTFRISNVAEGRLSLFVSEANGHAQARSMAGDSNVKLILMTDDERKAAEEKRRQEGLQE